MAYLPEIMDNYTSGSQPPPHSPQTVGSPAITTEMGPQPSALSQSVSAEPAETSPDARLEKEYHKDKVRTDTSAKDKEANDSSGDEDSSSRGRQKSREKKHYRKNSNVSASDTDRGSGKETAASSSKTPPPRKLKTFEPLQRKKEEESMLFHCYVYPDLLSLAKMWCDRSKGRPRANRHHHRTGRRKDHCQEGPRASQY